MRWLLLALVAGCSSNKVHGKVAGFTIPIKSSFLVYDAPAEGEAETLLVAMSSLPNGCAVYQYWFAQVAKAKGDPQALATGWANAFPEQFWEVILTLRLDAGTWPVAKTEWQGGAWDQPLTDPSTISAVLIQHNGSRPAEWFQGKVGYEQDFYSSAGVVKFGRSIPEQQVSGTFQTLTVDETGLATGPVKIDFRATPCPNMNTNAVLLTETSETAGSDTGAS